MVINCPHCYTRVVPKDDGGCPACQKDTRDTAGVDTSRVPIRVWQGDVLPPICCHCGRQTSRTVSVYRKTSLPGEPSTLAGAIVLWLLSWWFGLWLLLRGMAGTTVVRVALPQCDTCGASGTPNPRHVDFANARMTFIVHKNLSDAMTD